MATVSTGTRLQNLWDAYGRDSNQTDEQLNRLKQIIELEVLKRLGDKLDKDSGAKDRDYTETLLDP